MGIQFELSRWAINNFYQLIQTLIPVGYTNEISFTLKECAVGRYGVECRGICSEHCKGSTACNHVTGHCVGGCVVGWKGFLCNKGKCK